MAGAWAAGSDAPEKREIRIGFMPLTDCASVVMASVKGFDEKYGVRIVLSRESSWASVRDKLVSGELDMAHTLYGLVYGLHLGIGGPRKAMANLMTLNNNGQGLSFSRRLANKGAVDLDSFVKLRAREPREYTFAHTFPTGTHAMWLYYWLASAGINPLADVRSLVVPPPKMVAYARLGSIDGFSAGEPWNHQGIIDGVSVHIASSQQIWKDHPEKVLGASAQFVENNPNACRAVIMAVLEASRWIDAAAENRLAMASVLAEERFISTNVDVIRERILGHYQDGLGNAWDDPDHMKFFADGRVNYPYLSDGMWFLTQHKRWGLLAEHPDYLGVAREINQIGLYSEAATQLGVPLPESPMRTSILMDGRHWDGLDPAAYADSFAVCAPEVIQESPRRMAAG